MRKEFLSCQGLSRPEDRTIGALCAERKLMTSAKWNFEFRKSRAMLARLPHCCSAECAIPKNAPLFARDLANAPPPLELFSTCIVLRNARAFSLLPAALAFVSFGFVLVRVRVCAFVLQWRPVRDSRAVWRGRKALDEGASSPFRDPFNYQS